VPYFTILFAAALFAAEHASLAVGSMCDSAQVSGTVTSHAMGLPRAQGSIVVPSGCFPSCCMKLTGSLLLLLLLTITVGPSYPFLHLHLQFPRVYTRIHKDIAHLYSMHLATIRTEYKIISLAHHTHSRRFLLLLHAGSRLHSDD